MATRDDRSDRTLLGIDYDLVDLAAVGAANLVPLVGVLAWGWNLGAVIVIYWIENGVIGLANVPKLLLTARTDEQTEERNPAALGMLVFTVGFFLVHYGLFWLVHGVFVFTLFVPSFSALLAVADTLALAVFALVVQHAIGFYREFYRDRRYRDRHAGRQLFRPYGRVVVLHVTLILGAFVIVGVGTPLGGLVLLVVFKTVHDLFVWAKDQGGDDSGPTGWLRT